MKNNILFFLLLAVATGGCSSSTSTTSPPAADPKPDPSPVLTGSPTESGTFTLGSQTFTVKPGVNYPTYSVEYSSQAKYIYFALRSPLFLEITLLHVLPSPGDYKIDSIGSGQGVVSYNNSEYTSVHGTCRVTMFDTVNDVVSITFNVTMQHGTNSNDTVHLTGSMNEMLITEGGFNVGTMSADIDGVHWEANTIPNEKYVVVSKGGPYYSYVIGLNIWAKDKYASPSKAFLINVPWKMGSQTVAGNDTQQAEYWDQQVGTISQRDEYKTRANSTGTFTVTSIDTLHQRVSGTFQFDGQNQQGKTVHITNGRFDNLLWWDS